MSDRVVVGPLFTHAGFQSWFLVCLPERIVAVPMGLWFAIIANKAATLFVGGAAGGAMAASGEKVQAKKVSRLMELPEADVTSQRGAVVYSTSDLSSVTFKRRALSSPEIIVANRNAGRRVYGIMNAGDQAAIVDALTAKYGALVRKE